MTDTEKTAAKKPAAKKTTTKKASAKKPAAKKIVAKKTTAKKPAAKKTAAKKTTTKKPAAKKTAAKKTTAKKPAVKKTAAKKNTKKAVAKKTGEDATSSEKPKRTRKKGKALVVVESPAKARTIGRYLGTGFTVKASVGHVKDLPKSKMGVSIENDFEPEYVVINNKQKVIDELQKAAARVEEVYLAPDPDREGEAIAWHIAEELKAINPNIKRILINEITKKGIQAAMAKPTVVNTNKTNAQQARRILDRLVGYQISPILWKKVRRGLSAGRVQSVAVRLLVEREDLINAFQSDEYWTVECDCSVSLPPQFGAKVSKFRGEKAAPKTEEEAAAITKELEGNKSVVGKVVSKSRKRKAQPPFITSKLQQQAARKLRFSAKRTMALAQRLYEGIELGDEGPTGLITYMRTDSTRVSDDALASLRSYIGEAFGADYLPEKPNQYKMSKRAQDAHEAIRPTSMEHTPEFVKKALVGNPEGDVLLKLYTLIWQRFVASQMCPAVYDQTSVDIICGQATLRATGQILRFAGFTKVFESQETDDVAKETAANSDKLLPEMVEGQEVTLDKIKPEQHFTQPPPRFTEASLVKELEERGIGRPSTYAAILTTIVARDYAEKKEGRFFPTELGTLVNGLLVESFPKILDSDFTAQMENDLDRVEDGEHDWRALLGGFYSPFQERLAHAKEHMRDVKREEIPTEHVCEKCNSPMVIKWGRNGSFLACQGYPDCRNTKEISRKPDGTVEIVPEQVTDEICDSCSAPMVEKRGKYGVFLACSKYPECKTTKPVSVGVDCPKETCKGYVTQKRSRRGRIFYGCSHYAKTGCEFVAWDRPIPQACPVCNAPYMLRKENRKGIVDRCATCDHKQSPSNSEEAA